MKLKISAKRSVETYHLLYI